MRTYRTFSPSLFPVPCWTGQTASTMPSDTDSPWFKLVLLGEVGVGKTAIFHRLRDNVFRSAQQPTVSIDSCIKSVRVDGQVIKLTIWDTAGVERFRTLTRNYYRNAHGALLVYSVTQPASLLQLSRWCRDAKSFCPSALMFVIGNKTDLGLSVSNETATEFAQTHGCECLFQSSAKSGSGLQPALETITEKLLQHYGRREREESMNLFDDSVNINKGKNTGTCSC